MTDAFNNEDVLVRYLLGQLSEEEQEQIEEQYIGDGDFLDQLLVVEDDLIDDYVTGSLPAQDRLHFEQ